MGQREVPITEIDLIDDGFWQTGDPELLHLQSCEQKSHQQSNVSLLACRAMAAKTVIVGGGPT